MLISNLSLEDVAGYLRVELDEDDPVQYNNETGALTMAMSAALNYMARYTGRTKEYIEKQEDLTYVYLAYCAEMYENRQSRLTQGQYKNELLENLLHSHRVNLIAGEAEFVNGGEDA